MWSLHDQFPEVKKVHIFIWIAIIVITIICRVYILTALTAGAFIIFIILWIVSIVAFAEVVDKD